MDVPANEPKVRPKVREAAENPRAPSQTLQASVGMSNFQVHCSTASMACLEGFPGESLFSLNMAARLRFADTTRANFQSVFGGVMVWACFASPGPEHLPVTESNMNSSVYQSIRYMSVELNLAEIVMQQDNDPKLTSKSITEWLENVRITVTQSNFRLNLIKMLWRDLRRAVDKQIPADL